MTTQRVVIITGANSGLGLAAATALSNKNYHVILACRNATRAKDAIAKIKTENPSACLTYHRLDLADLSSVNEFADWFLKTEKHLYAILNNAGMIAENYTPRETTIDGIEITMAVNYLGHFLLTVRLLDVLKSSVSVYGEARIVSVSSMGHDADKVNNFKLTPFHVKELHIDDLNLEEPGYYSNMQAYKNAKAAIILFTNTLKRILEGTGVTATSCCPGVIPETEVFKPMPWKTRLWLYLVSLPYVRNYYGMSTIDEGVLNLIDLVDHPKLKGRSGIFYERRAEAETSEEVRDRDLQNKLWNLSCEMTKCPQYKEILVL